MIEPTCKTFLDSVDCTYSHQPHNNVLCTVIIEVFFFKNYKQPDTSFISNFRRVLNAVCFLLGYSPASEFYMPTFRNTLFHRQVGSCMHLPAYEDGTDRLFRNVGI